MRAALIALAATAAVPALAAPDIGRLDADIRALMAREAIGALHVTVVANGNVLLDRGYRAVEGKGLPPDRDALFPVGSISKQFTAATVAALAADGRLDIDAPVRDHLPEWFAAEPDLTIRHLLTHTSGLADFLWLDGYRPLADAAETPMADFVTLGARAPRKFKAGERWSYSNTNYKALALIVERVTGKRFDVVLAERVLQPMGVAGIVPCHDLPLTAYVPGFKPDGSPAPLDVSRAAYMGDGGLCANAGGLTRWADAVLSAPAADALAQPTLLTDDSNVPYGFGLSTRDLLGRRMIWHAGNVDGHSALIAHAPDDEASIVLLANKGFVWLTELLPAWLDVPAPVPAAGEGAAIAGRFEDGLFEFDIVPDGAGLLVTIDLIGQLVFVPGGPSSYIARDLPATFLIRLPDDGSRDRFEFDWGEVRSYARRVAD